MPRYRRSVRLDAGDVRRVRGSLQVSQQAFADELGVTPRTIQRWELEGAVLERVPSLLLEYTRSTLGRFDFVAERARFELIVGRGENVVLRRCRSFRPPITKKRSRKIAQAPRSRRRPTCPITPKGTQ